MPRSKTSFTFTTEFLVGGAPRHAATSLHSAGGVHRTTTRPCSHDNPMPRQSTLPSWPREKHRRTLGNREIHSECNQPRHLSLLLAHRSLSERQQIKTTYHAMFGKDLAGELHKILMGNQEDEVESFQFCFSFHTLKKNGFGEFEESLRVVVKCIYSPSMYYSKLLNRSLQCPATNKRLVTRAILGSDDVGMEKIKSIFKSSYGKDLDDFIYESLPESDYRDFLVGVARGSVSS
ncbi:hypothetical protein ABZP36_035153 [Zizania latifolia]